MKQLQQQIILGIVFSLALEQALPCLTPRGIVPRAQRFELHPRVLRQLSDPRLGSLAGRLTPQRLQGLINNPAARRFIDVRTGHINVIQTVEGRLLRITVPRDGFRIISVGPIQARNVANYISGGQFVPLP